MQKYINGFLTKSLWVVIILFAIRCLISMPSSAYDFVGCAGEAIAVAIILMGICEKLLWRYNPPEKIPKIDKLYHGKIEYNYGGAVGKRI